jgi:hypothetical protein
VSTLLFAKLLRRMKGRHPRILFLRPPCEDYLADGLLHGLRTVLGDRVVDHPKHDALYSSYPPDQRPSLYGRGFSLYGLLEDIEVDRERPLERALEGHFDLIVFADIWRTFRQFARLGPRLAAAGRRAAVVDTADRVEMYPYAGEWWRRPRWWLLPRAHVRFPYFKREITPDTQFFRYFMVFPRFTAPALPVARGVRPIAFSIPEEKIVSEPPEKTKLLGSHIVDPEAARRFGRAGTAYSFETEDEYYGDLRSSRFGITMKRAGWEALRHYEIAANGCVPCFRDLDRKPPLCAPHGLGPGNSISYSSAAQLEAALDAVDSDHYVRLQRGAIEWARANSTRARAVEFLRALDLY